jgi:glycosyltransferase involved in cell wall biosynthesis
MASFSLVLPTVGRFNELRAFFRSINEVDYDLSLIQLIIVDQNDEIDIRPLLSEVDSKIEVAHILSAQKGLSYNRNLGIQAAVNEILAFPDDDCEYYPDTLRKVHGFFEKNPHVFLVAGKIFDRANNRNVIRNWRSTGHEVTIRNFYTNSSSITVFIKNDHQIKFDDHLGSGSYFGSNEDTDLIVRLLKQTKNLYYDPEIQVFHPQPIEIQIEKVFSYGLGFGAFCKKNKMITLFVSILFYHFFRGILSLVLFRTSDVKYRCVAVFSRVKGFLQAKKCWQKDSS